MLTNHKMTGTPWKTSSSTMLISLYIACFTSNSKVTHTDRLSLRPKEKRVKVELCGLMPSEDWLNGSVRLTMLAQWMESNGETANSMLIMLIALTSGYEVVWAPCAVSPQNRPTPGPPAVPLQSQQVWRRCSNHGPPLHPPAPGLLRNLCQDKLWQEAACEAGETRLWLSDHQHQFPSRLRSFPSTLLHVHQQLHLRSSVHQAPVVRGWHHPHWTHLWWGWVCLQVGDWPSGDLVWTKQLTKKHSRGCNSFLNLPDSENLHNQ